MVFDRLSVFGRQIYLYGISYEMVLIVSPYWDVRFIYMGLLIESE